MLSSIIYSLTLTPVRPLFTLPTPDSHKLMFQLKYGICKFESREETFLHAI